jgi:(p)ppGpp synthase/HD superfamily hydrolase
VSDRIARSVVLAARVHEGQTDKGGTPYILHPLYVMHQVARAVEKNASPAQREAAICAAVLHDVIKDAPASMRPIIGAVQAAAGTRAVAAVEALTRWEGEPWNDYIDRVCKDWIARLVKVADLSHNQQLSRLGREPTEGDLKNFRRYVAAQWRIETFPVASRGEREG